MDIQGKLVLVLGGWGLVGSAISRKIMKHKPRGIVVTSLQENEAIEAVKDLYKEFPSVPEGFFVPWWGNIFVRNEMKSATRIDLLNNPKNRKIIYNDIFSELGEEIYTNSALYTLINEYKPDIIIDCINTATAIAYQDIYSSARDVIQAINSENISINDEFIAKIERLLCASYTPQIIRHIQILYRAMHESSTKIYVKIGTSGTGGMGLNIPYTHSEEKPSRVLLSKSAIAGAHTLLLFLMGRTPDAPITKEIKPTAAIAWKKIGFGEIKKQGKPIQIFDCDINKSALIDEKFIINEEGNSFPLNETLKSVFIDTGENGLFSKGEFETISSSGQMEYVTPEEIAEDVIYEIKGGNTGKDIINALDNASLSPTYRAGYMHAFARNKLDELEKQHNVASVAFEMLGPPRLSKLLFEAHILRKLYKNFKEPLKKTSEQISDDSFNLIKSDKKLRSEMISIGIPILLPNGKNLLRTKTIKIPPFRGENEILMTQEKKDLWAYEGWVDLRANNWEIWQKRLRIIIEEVESISIDDTSSRFERNYDFWNKFEEIDEGKIVSWIFIEEEKGERMKG
jgi:hypothetical protein